MRSDRRGRLRASLPAVRCATRFSFVPRVLSRPFAGSFVTVRGLLNGRDSRLGQTLASLRDSVLGRAAARDFSVFGAIQSQAAVLSLWVLFIRRRFPKRLRAKDAAGAAAVQSCFFVRLAALQHSRHRRLFGLEARNLGSRRCRRRGRLRLSPGRWRFTER